MKIILLVVAFIVTTLFVLPVGTAAAKCPADAGKKVNDRTVYCCGETQTSVDFGCKKDLKEGETTVTSVLLTIINFLAIGVGISVVGGIIWGSLYYITSNGNASKTQQGISIIVNSVVGLLLFIFLYGIINFLVPGGVFHS